MTILALNAASSFRLVLAIDPSVLYDGSERSPTQAPGPKSGVHFLHPTEKFLIVLIISTPADKAASHVR